MRRELVLGCGNRRTRIINIPGLPAEFVNPTLLDIDPNCGADILWDLTSPEPLPFPDHTFDEIIASEVLEHLGQQGDYKTFFRQFEDYWRVLKPGGILSASVPMWNGMWAWADPGHTRVISAGTLVFLDQEEYAKQIGKTAMTDYRSLYRGDFQCIFQHETPEQFFFALQARKT